MKPRTSGAHISGTTSSWTLPSGPNGSPCFPLSIGEKFNFSKKSREIRDFWSASPWIFLETPNFGGPYLEYHVELGPPVWPKRQPLLPSTKKQKSRKSERGVIFDPPWDPLGGGLKNFKKSRISRNRRRVGPWCLLTTLIYVLAPTYWYGSHGVTTCFIFRPP